MLIATLTILAAVFVTATALMKPSGGDQLETHSVSPRSMNLTDDPWPIRTLGSLFTSGQEQKKPQPEVVEVIGPISQDKNLRELPYIPPYDARPKQRLTRHPASGTGTEQKSDPMRAVRTSAQAVAMPTPLSTFAGITSAQSGCGCLPPDTDGDVGPNDYIQSVNSSIKIIDKTGSQLLAPTTYNSFFSALGTSTPCGNNQNEGDGVVFYDHIADRWVVSDFAFSAFPGTSFYQCIGVSKTSNPVAGGWWLYALQVDSANTNFLGDYPKFGVWPDAYYMSVNLFSNNTTFNGVRVYALPRSAMINGTGAPNPGAIAFTISPVTLGNAYSLLPATFRNGSPPAGQPEYFMAINSSSTPGMTENQVFTWRFHTDFATPANSTFGVGATHAPNGTITVNGFVDAFTATTSDIVPQTGTTAHLDTLGDKLMYPLVYQNLGGVESIYASHTVNNNQNGTGPTAIRWYQFNVTGNTIPATPTQQQTFNNGADGLWRFMPSINVDRLGDLSIGYSESSSTTNPAVAYAGRLVGDGLSTLAQGEATLIQGAGHQTSSSGRWGDYSATFVDPSDGCTFWHTNEYYSATSSASWNTRIGSFKFATCTGTSLRIDSVTAPAGRTSGGQQIRLTGAFAGLSAVTMGGSSASWFYTNGSGDTSAITVTTPAHAVGAVQIDLTPTSGSVYSKSNAFAYLPTVFTDDTIVMAQTIVKAQHIIELRQAVDAMRAVAGLSGAPWTDPSLAAGNTIRAVHILDLRTYLDDAATRLGYSTSAYTEPGLTSGFVIKRIHIEELRQRIRTIAG